jgi:hypothetical protein
MMHASARYTNAERSLMAWLQAGGIDVVPEDATRANSDDVTSFVRVSMEPGPEEVSGHRTADYHAARVPLQVRCQCFARGADSPSGAVDAASQLADVVADRLRMATVPILDYLADPTGATSTGERLQSTTLPSRIPLPSTEGWARRQVSALFFWFLRTEEA